MFIPFIMFLTLPLEAEARPLLTRLLLLLSGFSSWSVSCGRSSCSGSPGSYSGGKFGSTDVFLRELIVDDLELFLIVINVNGSEDLLDIFSRRFGIAPMASTHVLPCMRSQANRPRHCNSPARSGSLFLFEWFILRSLGCGSSSYPTKLDE